SCMAKGVSSGVAHTLPKDMKEALLAKPKALRAWEDITPLARNEWICWTISVKKAETRADHIRRLTEDLTKGKRRPCCWPGCPHRDKKTR
ncbi:MAG: hypothetical protein RLZZ480_736, partial [Candidatus Parcubacteria bacterium]